MTHVTELPGDVARAVRAHKNNQANLDGSIGLASVLAANTLFVWNYQDGQRAIVHSHSLPYALSGQCHVSVVQHQDTADISVALCSSTGNLAVWPNFMHSDEVATHRVSCTVMALAACPHPGKSGSIWACLATADAGLHSLKVQHPASGELQVEVASINQAPKEAVSTQASLLGRFLPWGGGASGGTAPSSEPVVGLHMVPKAGSQELSLLVLTASSLNKWQVSSDGQAQLLSSHNLQAQLKRSLPAAEVRLLRLARVPEGNIRGQLVAVLAASKSVSSSVEQLSIHVLDTSSSSLLSKFWQSLPSTLALPDHITPSKDAEAFLFWKPGAIPQAWSPSSGADSLYEAGSSLAASFDPASNAWLALNPSTGVVEVPVDTDWQEVPRDVLPMQASLPSGPSAPQSSAAGRSPAVDIPGILDASLAAGVLSQKAAAQLSAAGASAGSAVENHIAQYSSRIADMLPKHWGEPVGGGEVAEQLAAKTISHNSLLHILSAAGILQQLPSPVLRVLLENGERLQALAAVRDFEHHMLGQRASRSISASLAALQSAISHAGQQCMPQLSTPIQGRSEWEVFYAYPTISAPAFFEALAGVSEEQARAPASAAEAYDALLELSRATQTAMEAALRQREWQAQKFPGEAARALRSCGSPDWLVSEKPRRALLSAAQSVIRLQQALQSEVPEKAVEATGLLLDLTERLLNAFTAAILHTDTSDAAAMQRLVLEYGKARQETLQDALNGSIAVCTRGDARGEILLHRTEAVAEAHSAHAQIFDLCEYLADKDRLCQHMSAGTPEDAYTGETMAQYVFRRLTIECRQSELLDLPDAFNADLHAWLLRQDQGGAMLELRWLLELRMQRYILAAGTLARVGNAEGGDAQTFATAKRAACLAKLALLADQEGGLEPVPPKAKKGIQEAEASIGLLDVQSQLGLADRGPLPPRTLAEAALQASRANSSAAERQPGASEEHRPNTAAVLLVFRILALAGQQLNGTARGMLQEAWQLSVAATDWTELHRHRPQMTDAELADELGRTAVAQAASMCYGPQSAHQIPKWSSSALPPVEEAAQLTEDICRLGAIAGEREVLAAFDLGVSGPSQSTGLEMVMEMPEEDLAPMPEEDLMVD